LNSCHYIPYFLLQLSWIYPRIDTFKQNFSLCKKLILVHYNRNMCHKTRTPVTMNSFCSFCAAAGVKGPHDHFLRASKEQGAAVVCPKLLSTECNYCHRKGHTAKFCGAKREQQMLAAQARAKAKAAKMESGGWMTAGRTAASVKETADPKPTKPVAATKLQGMFAALDMADPSSSDEDECIGCESGVDCQQAHTCTQETSTWARVVREGKPKVDKDDELPPLIWGRRPMCRWADEEE
jgi:hypothetical protein